MTEFDIAGAALVAAFAYSGYRRGLMTFVLYLTGGLLAFALAAVLAPLLAPYVAQAVHVPAVVARPVAIILLTGALRLLFGFAVRELATALRALIQGIPPLALVDHLLGVFPGAALGALFVLALALAALTLPVGQSVHTAVATSWIAERVVTRPDEALAAVRRLWDGIVVAPPRLSVLPLGIGIGGLWLGAFAAYRMRGATAEQALREAPTRRIERPAVALSDAADPFAVPRAALGLAAAAAIMALLVGLSRAGG